jgi:hypothetical protein
MEQLITDFTTKYPRTTKYAIALRDAGIPTDVLAFISVYTKSLMAKLERGGYSKYLESDITEEFIDVFGATYLANVNMFANICITNIGDYKYLKMAPIIKPDLFVKTYIQHQNKVSI